MFFVASTSAALRVKRSVPAVSMSTAGPSPTEPVATQPERVLEEPVVVQQPRETQVRFVRPDKKPGFDAAYLAWTTYLVVGGKSRGSGVMIAPDKILTNCHVVAGNAMSGLIVINSATRERAKVLSVAGGTVRLAARCRVIPDRRFVRPRLLGRAGRDRGDAELERKARHHRAHR